MEDINAGRGIGGGRGAESDARWIREARSGHLVRSVRRIADANSWVCVRLGVSFGKGGYGMRGMAYVSNAEVCLYAPHTNGAARNHKRGGDAECFERVQCAVEVILVRYALGSSRGLLKRDN